MCSRAGLLLCKLIWDIRPYVCTQHCLNVRPNSQLAPIVRLEGVDTHMARIEAVRMNRQPAVLESERLQAQPGLYEKKKETKRKPAQSNIKQNIAIVVIQI